MRIYCTWENLRFSSEAYWVRPSAGTEWVGDCTHRGDVIRGRRGATGTALVQFRFFRVWTVMIDTSNDQTHSDDRGRLAETPDEISALGWRDIAIRIKREFKDDHVVLTSAGVAFFWFIALVPLLAAGVSLYGLIAPSSAASVVADIGPTGPAARHQPVVRGCFGCRLRARLADRTLGSIERDDPSDGGTQHRL